MLWEEFQVIGYLYVNTKYSCMDRFQNFNNVTGKLIALNGFYSSAYV